MARIPECTPRVFVYNNKPFQVKLFSRKRQNHGIIYEIGK